ncbi:MAG: sulfatase-like hydrolase/transferase, partial [Marinoscillum sp.]
MCTGLTVVFLCQWINCLTFGNTWVAILINVLLILSYGLLVCSQLITGESLDYKLAIENLANFKYMETIEMAIDLDWRFPVQLISVLVLLIFGDIYFKVFSKTVDTKRWSKFAVGLLGYGFFVVATPQRDELTLFAKSYSYHAFGGQYRNFVMPDSLSSFPYMKVIQPVNDTISAGRPHVFIVMMESANGFFIEKKSKDGREITPFFNSLIEKGIYVEHFYSNGNFTTNGQFGVFSGLAPSFKQNILLNQPDLKFMGLPAVMKKHGYHTLFMHGYHDLDFGGGKQFLFRAGFEEVKQMDEEFITDEDRQYIWGWGLQDDKIYEKFFSYLDRKK